MMSSSRAVASPSLWKPPPGVPDLSPLNPPQVTWVETDRGPVLPLYDFGVPGDEQADRALLVAHATGFHAFCYVPILRRLRGWRLLAADLSAHGDARTPDQIELSWEHFADDVLDVAEVALELTGFDSLLGFGHSKGGASVLRAEQKHPGLFEAIVAFEPIVMPDDLPPRSEPSPMVAAARRRRDRFDSAAVATENYRSKPPYQSWCEEAFRWYLGHGFEHLADGSIRIKCRPEWEAQVYTMEQPEFTPFRGLRNVGCPVTVLRGAHLQPGGAMWAEAIARQLPRGRYLEVEGVGHLGPMENPEAVARLVVESLPGGSLAAAS